MVAVVRLTIRSRERMRKQTQPFAQKAVDLLDREAVADLLQAFRLGTAEDPIVEGLIAGGSVERPYQCCQILRRNQSARAKAIYGPQERLMHKGAILDVHIVRSLRIAIHAGRTVDSARRAARCLPRDSNERGDLAVTLASVLLQSVLLQVMVRTIWPSACCAGQWSPRVTLVSK
jgi:hypothetical protein